MPDEPQSVKDQIEIWKNIVETQRHFNDIAIKIRSFILSLLTIVFGAIGYSIKENITFNFHNKYISISPWICILSVIIIAAFYILDKHYHKFLLASVSQGMEVEKAIAMIYPEIQLTTSIKEKSKNKFWKIEIHSNGRIRIFYLCIFIPLAALTVALFIMSGNSNIIISEYNKIAKESNYICFFDELERIPKKPGVVVEVDTNNKSKSIETKNLYYELHEKEFNGEVKYYYHILEFGRKEISEYINEKGILFE